MANRWIFLCIAFINKNISISIDNQMKLTERLPPNHLHSLATLKQISLHWNSNLGFVFPEKFTALNIYSISNRSLDAYTCGENGDLYAWNVKDWRLNITTSEKAGAVNDDIIPISRESSYRICDSRSHLNLIPRFDFNPALEMCHKINGKMFFNEKSFVELVNLAGKQEGVGSVKAMFFWLPFTDNKGEGVFRNIYTNKTFDNIDKYWSDGQPNGGDTQNNLIWDSLASERGLWDLKDVPDYFRDFLQKK